jgi:hypothetical protein
MTENPCPHCGRFNVSAWLREVIGPTLPDGLQLYDFGDGLYSMPVYDCANGSSFLTRSVSYLVQFNPEKTNMKAFGFEYPTPPQKDFMKRLEQSCRVAIEHWKAAAVIVEDGDVLPKAVRL